MCGIVGIAKHLGKITPIEISSLRDKLAHRGPDGQGYWLSSDERVGFGHRRLSILDLSESGRQPMLEASGRYALVFNGEVYNYQELRKELEQLGYTFRGTGDSEVVLAAYIHWGDSCLSLFNGMFAFAIYDSCPEQGEPTIFFARDRVGKKPLYLAVKGKSLAFASELKSISAEFRGGINLEALNFYLALGYIPDGLSFIDGVIKLRPGHAARFEVNSGKFRQWRWWSLPVLDPKPDVAIDDLVDQAEALINDSVRIRLRSDVPVGVLLSGGLDSSLVLASAARANKQVDTFTIGFPGSPLDETDHALVVAQHFETRHHVLELPSPSLSVLDELSYLVDEPLADSSLIPTYLVAKMTASHVKVALGGDGGDELFGGYNDYTTAMMDARRLSIVPEFILKAVAKVVGSLPVGIRGRNRIYALRGGAYQSLVWGSPYFDAPARSRILSSEAVEQLGDSFMAPELFRLGLYRQGTDPVDSMTRTHFGSILPDDFLVKVDRASMANGLEMRCPLLDYRLVEFAFSCVPSDWKVLGAEGRRIQKILARRLLPTQLDINRKQGFSIPLDSWLRSLDACRLDHLRNDVPSWINMAEVSNLIDGHRRGRANGSRLFSLLMLQMACKNMTLA